MKILLSLLLTFFVSGCAMNDMATREDVTQVEGSLSEEMIRLKRGQDQLQMELDDVYQRLKKLSQTSGASDSALDGRIRNLEQRMGELQNSISRLDGKLSEMDRQQQQIAGKINQEQDSKRAKAIERLEEQLNVILEEVSKENQRIISELNHMRASRTQGRNTTLMGDGYHVIQPGESLSQIASAYGVRVQELADLNQITNPNSIRVGQKLKIPKRQ